MKKTLIILAASAAALTSLSAPAIASARPAHVVAVVDHRGPGHASAQLNSRIATLDARIDQGRRTGQLSPREGRRLNKELNLISSQKRSFERSGRGLSAQEVSLIDNRLDRLQGQIHFEKHDFNNRRG
ncbi:MAG: hypothetical protein QM647_12050 [Asticcacaulis sp.]|uniref:hypothetical protein n=1 Tax=Asticcacaulis sp. TaxID=1872648 RepID=UPI0039E22680